ncbi:hypothetical protein ACTQ4Q_03735 [Bacillota bacterium LCP21S3_D9]
MEQKENKTVVLKSNNVTFPGYPGLSVPVEEHRRRRYDGRRQGIIGDRTGSALP